MGHKAIPGENQVCQNGGELCQVPPRDDFRGCWIWLGGANYKSRNSYACFRRIFHGAGEWIIYIAADTFYNLFMDGRRVDRGTATSAAGYKTFDTHVVAFSTGEHVIGVVVHHLGESCAAAMQSRPGLFVEMTAGSGEKIVTDETWKVLPLTAYEQDLPCMMSHFGFYEVCDYRKIPAGWTAAGFDDRSWYNAAVIGKAGCEPWIRMIPRDIPLLATKTVPAEKVIGRGTYENGAIGASEKHVTVAVEMAAKVRKKLNGKNEGFPLRFPRRNAFAVVDFGREVTGHVRLEFAGGEDGRRIDIGYDETLDKQGYPNPRRTYVHFADRYFLRDGQEELEVFNARGFRYLLIDVSAGRNDFVLTGARIDERTYPVSKTGYFRCSDPALGQIYQTSLETLRLCMLDCYVDCPSRERVMWMDSYLEGLCGSYGFGITDLWRRSLYLFAQNVSRDTLPGAVKGFAPTDSEPLLLSYVLYYICSVADYLLHSGDAAACESLFETVRRQFEILEGFELKSGLLGDKWPGWGTFLDWSAMDFGGISAGNNALYIKALRKSSWLAGQLQKHTHAAQWREKDERLIRKFRETFRIEDEDLFADSIYDGKPGPVRSQLSNIMAIWAGAADDKEGRELVRKITDPMRLLPRTPGDYRLRGDFQPQTGGIVPIGTPGLGFLAAYVMFKLGLACEAQDYLKENWPPISKNGTFAEHFVFDANTSYCQGWSAGPVVLLSRFVLGVRPVSAGWKEIEIDPQPGRLTWAEGMVPTPHGDIQVSWKMASGKPEVHYQVPAGIQVVSGPMILK